MIDFHNLEHYRENNRIEAKTALGGLPKSIWETYSAFANTYGGIILLGVVENRDKSFYAVNLPEPQRLIEEFLDIVNDPEQTSVNILSERDVYVQDVDGCSIVVIDVPRADRFSRPVWVNGDEHSVYRRNGEGDYKCTAEEYAELVRDASRKPQDLQLVETQSMQAMDRYTVAAYRKKLNQLRPGNVWETLDDEAFLCGIGAAGYTTDDRCHPTAAGLLLFGRYDAIMQEFPDYSLRYLEDAGEEIWTGNVYEFYLHMEERLAYAEPDVQQVLCEVLGNCLMHADYRGYHGIVIRREDHRIVFSNPGGFRISHDDARTEGVSDGRNGTMQKLLHMVDVGQCAGNGIPHMYRVWREHGWMDPIITESLSPSRITVTLRMEPGGEKPVPASKSSRKLIGRLRFTQRDIVLQYLTDYADADLVQLTELLNQSEDLVRHLMEDLIRENIAEQTGEGRYRLRA